MKLGFIGTGNMASAMMGGIIKNNIVPAEEIIGSDLFAPGREKVQKTLGIHVTESMERIGRPVKRKRRSISGSLYKVSASRNKTGC